MALLPAPVMVGQAFAENECGTGTTVTCVVDPGNYPDGITYYAPPTLSLTFDPGVVVSPPPGTGGLNVSINGDLSIDTRQGTVTTTGAYGYGIQAYTSGALTITTADVSTTGDYAGAVSGSNGESPAIIDTTAGSISTTGKSASGIYGSSSGSIAITTGDVTTSGINSNAVSGYLNSYTAPGTLTIDTTRGQTTTTGGGSVGVYSNVYNGGASITTGAITTQGDSAPGIAALHDGVATIDSTAGLINTSGDGSAGIHAWSFTPTYAADIRTGGITTTGAGAFAVAAAAMGSDNDFDGVTEGSGSITITITAPIRATGSEAGGVVAVSYPGDSAPSGTVTVNANANITASGQNAPGVAASSSTAPVAVTVAAGVSVMGGWAANPGDLSVTIAQTGTYNDDGTFGAQHSIGSNLPAAGVVIFSGATSTVPAMSINNQGVIGALSDLAITMGTTCAAGGGSSGGLLVAAAAVNDGSMTCMGRTVPVQALHVQNDGVVEGYITFWPGAAHVFNNNGTFNIRHFADTDGDGVRDTKRVSISDFGGPNATFNNISTDTVKFAPVSGARTVDPANYYVPTTGIDGRSLGTTTYDLNREGVVQGQFINLATFNNTGTIDLRGPVVGNTLLITGGASAATPGTGVFVSNGGQLLSNVVLNGGVDGDGGSIADVLIVDRTQLGSGATQIAVTNVGGAGALTPGNGIELVEVRDKPNSAAGAFALAGRVVAGPYQYSLYHGGVGADAADGNWYLRSVLDCTQSPPPAGCPTPPAPKPGPDPDPGPGPGPGPGPDPTPPAPVVPDYRQETSLYSALPSMG
ncbi:hypothetical protein, partial [Reyranella sp. CPCC 100927]|uniref:hypothetical protein n=1 Tax=Reyranella sp. CPCC 100927 TaxID=2599616 RepID=UPI0011B8AF3E